MKGCCVSLSKNSQSAFTLIELLVVIAIIAILTVVVILTLNPAELLRQARDSNRVSDMATISNALNVYLTDQGTASSFSLGNVSATYPSVADPSATSTAGDQCQGLSLSAFNASSGQYWQCSALSNSRGVGGAGWIPINLSAISSGAPISNLPVDPANQTSSGLFYAYNTNGSQFEVTANLESQKYRSQYGTSPQTSNFPEVISGGTPTVSALYNPTGIVGWWPLTEGSGSSSIDQSGSENNGTWQGIAPGTSGYYSAGKVGNWAGAFDGTSTIITTSNSALLQPDVFTFAAWEKYASVAGINPSNALVTWKTSGDPGIYYSIAQSKFIIQLGSSNFQYFSKTTGNPTDGNWHFLVFEIPGNATTSVASSSMYMDGVAQTASTLLDSGATLAKQQFTIGGSSNITAQVEWSGLLDDVRMYNRLLSPAEIQALYTAEK